MRTAPSASTLILPAIAAAALALPSFGQIVPVGPFVGDHSEGFENGLFTYQETACVQPFILGASGTLCDSTGMGTFLGSTLIGNCTVTPHSGTFWVWTQEGFATYQFGQDVARFGGYFASAGYHPDITVRFYDAAGALIDTQVGSVPADCAWHWNGWESQGNPFRRVEVLLNNPFGGKFAVMDDMQVVLAGNCKVDAAIHCTAAPLNGCWSYMDIEGTPTLSQASNSTLGGFFLPSNQFALLFFGTTGPASIPFFDDLLCVSPPLYRLHVVNTTGQTWQACQGTLSYGLHQLLSHPQGGPLVTLGSRIDAQIWARDFTPSTTSTSNALSFTFCP
jgi:hypothetical protein